MPSSFTLVFLIRFADINFPSKPDRPIAPRTPDWEEISPQISLFIDPEERQIQAAKDAGATVVELHTGRYADLEGDYQIR